MLYIAICKRCFRLTRPGRVGLGYVGEREWAGKITMRFDATRRRRATTLLLEGSKCLRVREREMHTTDKGRREANETEQVINTNKWREREREGEVRWTTL